MLSHLFGKSLSIAARSVVLILAAAAFINAGCAPIGYAPASYIEPEISDYEFLSQYGEWISLPHYGLVWRPYVVADWSPFYYGHWIWTDDGWTWISYEPFGALVYHYGYWDYSLRYGWVWIPDDYWSPARVEWYTFDGYCGWAPMPPPRMRWHDPWDPWDVDVWVVVPTENFTDEDVGRYRLSEPTRREFVKRGTAVKSAPTIRNVETAIKKPVTMIPLERERLHIDRDVTKTQPKPGRPGRSPLKTIVLPEKEREKVDKNAPKVQREVLRPEKRETQNQREQKQREDEKSRAQEQKKEQGKKQEQEKKEKGRR